MGIFWFHKILTRIQFAGRLTLVFAMYHECKSKNFRVQKVQNVGGAITFIVELLVWGVEGLG